MKNWRIKKMGRVLVVFCFIVIVLSGCAKESSDIAKGTSQKIRVILDTDANNELDDQHAIAYMLFSGDVFDVEGITVNKTYYGGEVEKHLEEAERVVKLCGLSSQVKVYKGASGSFDEIKDFIDEPDFDGFEAVNFLIARAKTKSAGKLVLLPVGKLTNIALALEKDPSIVSQVRIFWLGSNYPEPGEYNQDNDHSALNYILETVNDFEIAVVRYGKPSGTDAVRVTLTDIKNNMPGKGPHISVPVVGRHGKKFINFGDYSINLFENIELHGNPPSRALYDMAAVAIVKNASWATPYKIPSPTLVNGKWINRPENSKKIIIWENFNKEKILQDFYHCMEKYVLAK